MELNHKCNGCRYRGEHREPMFKPFGVCTRETNLIKAEKAYKAEVCPYKTKPCEYCHEDREGYYTANGTFWIEKSAHEGWQLHGGKCKPRPINYCFMCGRKLNDGT